MVAIIEIYSVKPTWMVEVGIPDKVHELCGRQFCVVDLRLGRHLLVKTVVEKVAQLPKRCLMHWLRLQPRLYFGEVNHIGRVLPAHRSGGLSYLFVPCL